MKQQLHTLPATLPPPPGLISKEETEALHRENERQLEIMNWLASPAGNPELAEGRQSAADTPNPEE